MPQQTSTRRRSPASNGRSKAGRSSTSARSSSSARSSTSARSSSSARKSSSATIGRAGGAVRESDLADLRVDELRDQLRKRGVTGTSNLRKPDLIKSLARAMRRGTPARAKQASRPKAGSPTSRRSAPAGKSASAARKSTSSARSGTSSTARKSTSSAGRSAGSARKSTSAARKSAGSTGRNTSGAGGGGRSGGAKIRSGAKSSSSLKYAQRIDDPQQHAERAGRSLITTDHRTIRQWADARGGTPATVSAPRDGRPSVLRIDFPGYGGGNLRKISWDEWFGTFDQRRLNFIYQEQRTDGTPSNFFRLESPDREDA
ncbi:hypothetical protein ACN27J_15755 [Solwaraspora sp. WMMB762]|uniref:hypothetical protein n=1 Tax=Solwaraspora sp. WMMB762 TaxID=3404120 RepID=UPI003B950D00